MEACKLAVAFLCILAANIATAVTEQRSPAQPPAVSGPPVKCAPYLDTQKYRTTNFQNVLNTTVAISPQRPNTDVPVGSWITGRATYYGTDPRWENIHTSCGEPAGQFGILAQGSCGYTNSDGSLVFPKDTYAAAADTNEDYPGSCGRCYQVQCAAAVSKSCFATHRRHCAAARRQQLRISSAKILTCISAANVMCGE